MTEPRTATRSDTHRKRVARKRLVSIRLDTTDVERVRRIAERLQARESDVFRFALSLAFSRLAPLCESNARGADLLPLLIEFGPEMIRHFNLDAQRLLEVVNDGSNGNAIEAEDIELLAMRAVPDNYLHARMRALVGDAGNQDTLAQLRSYFYAKYFATGAETASRAEGIPAGS